MIYTGGSWSIWLATREGAWGWLADSFTHYFRMALVHLGLPGWQAAFANLPLIPWAEVIIYALSQFFATVKSIFYVLLIRNIYSLFLAIVSFACTAPFR